MKTKTVDESNPLASLHSKIKKADPEIQRFIVALNKLNLKLQREVAKYQADIVSLRNQMKAQGELGPPELPPELEKKIDIYLERVGLFKGRPKK